MRQSLLKIILIGTAVISSLAMPLTNQELKSRVRQCLRSDFTFDSNHPVCANMSSWDTSEVTDFGLLFISFVDFNENISRWNTSSAIYMDHMFYEALAFNGDISGWDTSRVTLMWNMFFDARSFNGDLSRWNTSSVTDMRGMFERASSFNGDISAWDTSRVERMDYIFYDAPSFNVDLCEWDRPSLSLELPFVNNPKLSLCDVDECRSGAHACDSTEACSNTDGSFTCACGAGYISDGEDCKPDPVAADIIAYSPPAFYCFHSKTWLEDCSECPGSLCSAPHNVLLHSQQDRWWPNLFGLVWNPASHSGPFSLEFRLLPTEPLRGIQVSSYGDTTHDPTQVSVWYTSDAPNSQGPTAWSHAADQDLARGVSTAQTVLFATPVTEHFIRIQFDTQEYQPWIESIQFVY